MRKLPLAAAIAVATLAGTLLSAGSAQAAAGPASPVSAVTTVGVHNAYEKGTYAFLAQSLDVRPGLIELDVWPDIITREWKVSHSNPLGNNNNCVAATTAAGLYSGGTNKNLEFCLDDIRLWLGAHPDAGPLYLKLELKTGFSGRTNQGPAQLDATIAAHLGAAVFKPADLVGGFGGADQRSDSATLDQAARAGAWPTRAQLAGKVIIEAIPGTVEEGNPTDTLWTDVEYARYLAGLATAGTLSRAQIFPAVHRAQAGDPRTRYSETNLRGWFVVFDGDASTYVGGTIDTSWYDTNHYLLIMTDAQNVPPVVSNTDAAAAQARVAALAAAHASVASADWATLPDVLDDVLQRG
jgi:hypothetical protein